MLFWSEISAIGVFFNFENERMRPPKYPRQIPNYYFSKQICNTEPMFVSRKMEVKVIKSGMFYVSFLLYTMRLVEFSRLEIFVS